MVELRADGSGERIMKFGQKFALEKDMSPATKRVLGIEPTISESELPEATTLVKIMK